MNDKEHQNEIVLLRRIAESHRQLIDAMLTNSHAFITLLEVKELYGKPDEAPPEPRPIRTLKKVQ